jgi:hypothetical protein
MIIYFVRATKFSGGCKIVTPQVTLTSLEVSPRRWMGPWGTLALSRVNSDSCFKGGFARAAPIEC